MTTLSWAGLRKEHGTPDMFYSPSQPRGDDGRFIKAGGSSSGGGKSGSKAARADDGDDDIFSKWDKGPDGNHRWSDPKVQPLIDKYMATEKVVSASPEAAKRGKEVYDDAVAREPKISASVQAAAEASGATLERFDFRLKGLGSLSRKIETIAQDTTKGDYDLAKADIKDAVRYTAVVPEDGYWAAGTKMQESLKERGWTDNGEPADGWSTMFRGRMLKMKDENGYPVEVQVHTEASLEAAEIGHYIYNANRLPGVADADKATMNTETLKIFDSIPLPSDLPNKAKFPNAPSAKNRYGDTKNMDGIDPRSATNAQRLAQAKLMYSPGSKQLKAAIKRWS